MANIRWTPYRVEVTPPKRPKKITGTRLASIFGLNKWSTPFKTWCDITKTWVEPFVDTKYTRAGKIIEPKQAEYMKKAYAMTTLKTPQDIYGDDYFNVTHGDFFPSSKIFGGMWDYLVYDEAGNVDTVLEMKTTSRSEDWREDVPEYYAIQAALYAWLLGVDKVVMVCSMLDPGDYDHPEDFVPSVDNTITVPFRVSERYPNFENMIRSAEKWWYDHVLTGISPEYDEKKDSAILDELRTNSLSPDTDIQALIAEAEGLKEYLEAAAADRAAMEKRLKAITDILKQFAMERFRDGDTKVEIPGGKYNWILSRGVKVDVDKNAIIRDGLMDKYQLVSTTYRMTVKAKEEN